MSEQNDLFRLTYALETAKDIVPKAVPVTLPGTLRFFTSENPQLTLLSTEVNVMTWGRYSLTGPEVNMTSCVNCGENTLSLKES
ncbi:hypothetical protein C1B90_21355 [Salmonella enterica]|uniref:Uncharacterized protein n=1 Tax=Salmonella enterica TaxID=28901 RepID=A0A5T4LPC6_SALER|nr:hypothetical protein [Salmonella enterica]